MKIFYNEYDPGAAAWLRELINQKQIPEGHVDTRSITEVRPADLAGYVQCHFFAGIGGWAEALRLAGWPEDRPVWTGSCPCQPFSSAGKQKGTSDERHLWPEFRRLIAECRPATVFGEQVASRLGREWLSGVRADLEGVGYAVGAADLCAAGVGAPHIRQRLYWVAHRHVAGHTAILRGCAGELHRDGVVLGAQLGSERGGAVGRLADVQQQGLEGHARHGDDGGQPRRQLPHPSGSVAAGGGVGGVAYPDGGLPGDRGVQPGGQHGQQPQDGGVGGLEHSQGDGREQRGSEPSGRGAAGGCESGGVDHPAGARREEHDGGQLLPGTVERCEAGGVGNATGERCGGGSQNRAGQSAEMPGARHEAGFWSDSILLPCRDGKARRIERKPLALAHGVSDLLDALRHAGASEEQVESTLETFPLARNQSGRVMLLRGFGNAICVPLAATFIEAFNACLK